jgi:spermidine synthase
MGLWAYPAWVKKLPIYLILAVVTSIYLLQQNNLKNVIDIDTQYNRALIFETTNGTPSQPIRVLKLNTEYHSAMYVNSDELAVEYTMFYRLAKYYNPNIKSALMIGGGAFSYPKDFLNKETSATMDVVEIDPGITEIAKKHFRLQDSNRLQIFHEDGRTYLNRNQKKYDAIYIDAFLSYYSIPFQLTTLEATKHIERSLSKNGVVMVNVVSTIEGNRGQFFRALYKTYKSTFKNIAVFPVDRASGNLMQNIMLVAWNNDQPLNIEMDEELSYFLSHRWNKPIPEDMPILTDEFAPVDQYIAALMKL